MGLGSDAIELLIRLRQEGHVPLRGSVIEIGAQQLANSFLTSRDRIVAAGELFGASAECPLSPARATQIIR
jgi:hypothetical protein